MAICRGLASKVKIHLYNGIFFYLFHEGIRPRWKDTPDNLSVKSKMQNDVYRKIAFIKQSFNSQIKNIYIYMQRSA